MPKVKTGSPPLLPVRVVCLCAPVLTTVQQTWEDKLKARDATGGAGGGGREETGKHEIEIPGEWRVTAGLRIKQRAVTTQEAAVEDDRSAGLQIGTVGVRGQLMNIHLKNKPQSYKDVNSAPSARRIHRWHLLFFLKGGEILKRQQGSHLTTVKVRRTFVQLNGYWFIL